VAPLRRSSTGSFTAILTWLHYADHRLAPLRRSRIGSIAAIRDKACADRLVRARHAPGAGLLKPFARERREGFGARFGFGFALYGRINTVGE
jgi:hypothetical protein